MRVLIGFLSFFVIFTSSAAGGIGGSEGGPGAKTWQIEVPKGSTIDWPMIRVHRGRNLPLNHFCIRDDETLRTLIKYGPKYDLRLDSRSIFRLDQAKQNYQVADRYFDDYGCYGSWDPKCSEVNSYIEETVKIPVYKGKPRSTRGGEEDLRDFARRAILLKEITTTIPSCENK